jgi:hypothetical protein
MTKAELLQMYLEKEKQTVFELSADYQHKTAKKGFEQEHEDAVVRVSLLEEMLETT